MSMRTAFVLVATLVALSVPSLASAVATVADSAAGAVRTDPVESMVKVTFALGLVVAAIFAVAWLFRRMGGLAGVNSGSLRIVGGISLGGRERVVLVQVGDEQILLGVAPGRVQSLHVLAKPIDTVKPLQAGESFAAKLQAALMQRKSL